MIQNTHPHNNEQQDAQTNSEKDIAEPTSMSSTDGAQQSPPVTIEGDATVTDNSSAV
ncbi:hypothetical protein SARC_01218 [Sphaeroforma arctica JP610]|uniref:Uncharacterized protein n=1 Tax=Sphaeroforma arctica JP610 TaxID=667725 RepID=A0A0L0GEH1_9EUKA|nr:hypothetical protein SARC_01218 [Sphaeroforma arctica JP610]KNC86638.1 hypothetical protein SARC_01218 [Sphaeroforma arctica JP610]|eukprot:XP_014160540.1 hypothetical protein SARC_01218 [Sphaeroforma arctica JP610]